MPEERAEIKAKVERFIAQRDTKEHTSGGSAGTEGSPSRDDTAAPNVDAGASAAARDANERVE